ncbi:MAG: helix-turn-helix domain-containing protein [Candidatus Omnitrophica bacterium]|nr:helix-turn-helix domain-containing protein [Candidatus Omnitrophota bacterium]
MTLQEKLRLIQKFRGKSQEKLAAELGVSFPTLNSWINGRSLPRKKAREKIDETFLRCTGQNVIPSNVLEAKKQEIERLSKKYSGVLRTILNQKDIYDQFVLSLTFHTNRIEGSTLTEPETAAILFEGAALPDKTLTEQLEAKNHQTALHYLFHHLEGKEKVDEELVLKLHGILLNSIQHDAGRYRNHGVRITGANVPTANPEKVPALMKDLFVKISEKRKDVIAHAAFIHSIFEQIHPFSDGNGRIGRLLLHGMLLSRDLPPAMIRQEKRRFYILYLNQSQLQNDFSRLEDFICDSILESFEHLNR